jgi:hypothetical protein
MDAPTKWHEATEAFPIMVDGDLDALVADIKENGLRHPITLLPDGTGLDGRNRLKACEQAGVEARFDVYDGDDPEGFVISENVTRRHLKPSQRAMAAARMMPERENGKKRPSGNSQGKKLPLGVLSKRFGVSEPTVKMARALLDRAPDLATEADAGEAIKSLYNQLQDREQEEARRLRSLQRIAQRDADLAEAIENGTMTLAEALAEGAARERQAEQDEAQRQSVLRAAAAGLDSVLVYLTSRSRTPEELASDYADAARNVPADRLNFAVATMRAIAQTKEE